MFVRKKPNNSSTISIQIIKKIKGKNKVIESIGCSKDGQEINQLLLLADRRFKELNPQMSFDFITNQEQQIINFLQSQ